MATNSDLIFGGLAGNGSNTDATSYATASSGTLVSGRVVFAAIATYKATTPDIPTCTGTNGLNGSWVQVGTVTIGSDLRLTVFWSVTTSTTAGIVTFDFGGNTQLAAVWAVCYSPFVNITTPVVQSKTATDTSSATTMTVTLDNPLAASRNWVLGFWAQRSASSFYTNSNFGYYLLGVSSTSTSDGLQMRGIVYPTTAMSIGGLQASISKVAIAFEVAQDGTDAGAGTRAVVVQAGG